MQQLQFVELDEGGRLVLTDDDGTQYAVRVDDRLRAALRPRPRQAEGGGRAGRSVTPRDVQAMIRAGQPAEDVAGSTGWELERVRRFEGPVVAEREHVVGLAQRAPVRASGRTDGSHTLERRVRERLQSRGVDLTAVSWDAARGEAHEPWTVIVAFMAGGRERRGAWHYDVRSRWVEALDDEARWLSEDEQSLPGGLAGHPLLGGHHGEDEAAADLMATMRERRQRRAKGRRGASRRTPEDPSHVPGQQEMPDEVLPLEDLPYDPDTMGDPPAAHPRGSAPEAAAPVGPDEDELFAGGAEGGEPVDDAPEGRAPDGEAPDGGGPDEAPLDVGGDVPTEDTHEAAAAAAPTEPEVVPEPVSPEEAQRAVGRSPGRRRRRLRLPSLSAEQQEKQHEPEGSFARTRHDPREVTFDEFFGMEDDEDDPGGGIYTQPEVPADEGGVPEDTAEGTPEDLTPEDTADEDTADEDTPEDLTDEDAADEAPRDELDEALEDGSADADADAPDAHAPEAEVSADEVPEDSVDPETTTDDEPAEPTAAEDEDTASEAGDQPTGSDGSEAGSGEEASPTKSAGRKGRTSVPSWDDIMFGSRPPRG
ncbi:septation protein SepH [uncultured Serinicoccus sp.]|uniref:septation protein SepH n=1 Tax=uncultured Serinicoccus sp. TaxID=735514 RepID=UPI00261CF778|nr:septation protein SepH [uncultured Serinicoccus sp.]